MDNETMERDHNFSWKSEQMIENASKWSLAGDVSLLNHLKSISDFLLSETNSTSVNINKLLNKLDTVSLKLDMTRNEFHSLRNTQFIENRVYEDDETLTHISGQPLNNPEIKEDKEGHIKDLIQEGLFTINKYFDKIEVSVSDSEDEETETSYILQPKDMYCERPLPYLIGTQEWYTKWHVGLKSETDSESEKEEDSFSSSTDSDDDILKDKILGSGTSSELEFNNKINEPVTHSIINDSSHVINVNLSETSSQHDGSFTSKAPVSNINFAEQLAAKLHNINTSTINKSVEPSTYGNLFSEEPPPLNETDRIIKPNNQEDLFSSSFQKNDLFTIDSADNQNNNILQENNSSLNIRENKLNLNQLNDSSSEEDISRIAEKRKGSTYKYSMQNQKVALPYVEDKPPEMSNKSEVASIKKKLVGQEYAFGQSPDMLSVSKTFKKNIFNESSGEESEEPINKVKSVLSDQIKNSQATEPRKTLGLFDDEDDDDVSANSQEHHVNIFGNDNSKISKSIPVIQKSQQILSETLKVNKKISLFDDDDLLNEDDSFFNDISIKKRISSLSEELKEKKSINLFESDDEDNKIMHLKKQPLNTKNLSLFDDSDDDGLVEDANKSDIAVLEKHEQQSNKSYNNSDENVVKGNLLVDFELSSATVDSQELVSNESEVIKEEKHELEIGQINQPANMSSEKGIILFDSNNSSDDELFKTKINKNNSSDNDSNATFDNAGITSLASNSKNARVYNEYNSLSDDISYQIILDNQKLILKESDKNLYYINKKENNFEDDSDKYNSPPPINLFDSNPPPDTEWDARSDSADSDRFSISDAVLDHLQSSVQPQRSSLFDNEPPSLDIINDVNSSSGIIKDFNITSSSRRPSIDVYNEQQSQDSFFVTKKCSENTNSSSLVPILEDLSSKIDYISPSGGVEDLTDDSSWRQREDELKAPKNMNEEHNNTKESDSNKISDISQTLDNTEDIRRVKQETSKNKPSPGKLKHNLNINVAALMPGARPLSKVNLISSPIVTNQNNPTQSSNNEEPSGNSDNAPIIDNPNVLIGLTKNRVKIPVKRRPSTRRARQEAARKSMTEFGHLELGDNSSLITEGNKTFELNATDIPYETAKIEKAKLSPEFEKISDSSPALSNTENKSEILGKIEDESMNVEVVFSEKLHLNKSNEEYKPEDHTMEKVKNKKQYTFDEDDSSSDDDFFRSVNKNSKTYKSIGKDKSSSNTKGLFSDKSESDSDSELFGAKSNVSTNSNKKPLSVTSIKKSSIFDDLDDSQSDSDLFGSKLIPTIRNQEVKKVAREKGKIAQTSHIRKLQNKEVTNDDPLSALK